MIVIAKNAEKKLVEDLKKYREESMVQRCYYMAFSKSETPKKELFESFLTLLQDVPDSYKAEVYICEDKDVFILMKGFMQREFTIFLKNLAADLGSQELLNYAEVLEVSVEWTKLEAICLKKMKHIESKQAKETEARRKIAAEKVTLEVLEALDSELVESISARRSTTSTPNILVVDDDQIARTLVGNVVREDYGCLCVPDGQSAIREYVSSAPHAVFLDIGLPDINGHDVLEAIFQIDPEAYIIMFSGRKDKDNIMRALEAGAQGFVGKPFTREKIYEYIKKSPHLVSIDAQSSGYANTAS